MKTATKQYTLLEHNTLFNYLIEFVYSCHTLSYKDETGNYRQDLIYF